MARRLAFVNEKGGTGKTTLSVHCAAWLAARGQRVLLIDVDTQGHAGKTLGIDVRALEHTVAELLLDPHAREPQGPEREVGAEPMKFRIQTGVPGLHLLPANKCLADLPERIGLATDRFDRLAQVVDRFEANYDFVIFDAPPSLGLLTRNVMMAAYEVIVPVAVTYLSLDGCAEVVQSIEAAREEGGNRALALRWVVPTLARRTRLAREVLAKLEAYFPEKVAPALGFNVQIDEAQSHGQTIWEYAPWSRGAQMLDAIAATVSGPTQER